MKLVKKNKNSMDLIIHHYDANPLLIKRDSHNYTFIDYFNRSSSKYLMRNILKDLFYWRNWLF